MLPGKKYTPGLVLDLLWRRKWLFAIPVIACSYAALVVCSRLPDIYESDMLIQIIPQRVPDSYVRSTVTIRTEDRIDVITQQVKSRTQLEQMIVEFGLYPAERERLPMEDVVERMRADIFVDIVRSTGGGNTATAEAFHVRFRYPDANLAARITQRLGTLFVDQNARDRGTLAEATNDFLEAQLTEARSRLEAQEQKLERFRQEHAGRLPSNVESNMQAIQSFQMQVQAQVESLARDRDRKLMLERLYNDSLAEPVVPPPFPATAVTTEGAVAATPRQQLDAARANLARLELRLTAEHPDVVRARRLVAELEARIENEPPAAEGAIPPAASPLELARRERIQHMRAEIESLDRQIRFKESEEARLRSTLLEYQRRIEAVPGTESEWTSLSRDYDTLQTAYRQLLTKSEESKVAADLERRQIGEQFRVLDPARVPVRPISPNRLQINGIGAGAGLALALGILGFLELRDSSFRSEADVIGALALPVVALVPYLETDRDRRRARWRRWLLSAAAVGAIGAGGYTFWVLELWKHII